MRFGRTLQNSAYAPWKSEYIDYRKLKKLLREDEKDGEGWTEEDEGTFVEELVNVQLEKVNAFQVNTYKNLRERTSECEGTLDGIVGSEGAEKDEKGEKSKKDEKEKKGENGEKADSAAGKDDTKDNKDVLHSVLAKLDKITTEVNELEKYSRLNFTGFLKAAKKHDRRRGSKYKVRPLLQVRLAALPFNSEDYSPLLYR